MVQPLNFYATRVSGGVSAVNQPLSNGEAFKQALLNGNKVEPEQLTAGNSGKPPMPNGGTLEAGVAPRLHVAHAGYFVFTDYQSPVPDQEMSAGQQEILWGITTLYLSGMGSWCVLRSSN